MIIAETKNIEEIKSILCHPEIYKVIGDDNSMSSDQFEPPLTQAYVAGYVEGDIIGIMIYHRFQGKLKCHIQVLPEYRKQYAQEFARMVLSFGEAKNAIIYAEIPECYQNVLKFAKSFGFLETGNVIEKDCLKDGVYYDVIELRLKNGNC